MTITMRPDTVVGYTYRADLYCPECIVSQVIGEDYAPTDTEMTLDAIAAQRGIERYDERSYDSGDFPKVVFHDSTDDDDRCGKCGRVL